MISEWKKILGLIENRNLSLHGMLHNVTDTKLVRTIGNNGEVIRGYLQLFFPVGQDFLREQCERKKNRSLIEGMSEAVLGYAVTVETKITSESP